MARYYQSRCELPGALETRVPSARSQAALAHLKVEGLRVRYIGPGEEDSQAASMRTDYPVPPDVPLYYFEVEIVNAGQHGFIGIGFQTEDVLLSRLPGWEHRSYGYHGDDGHKFTGSGAGRPFGPSYSTGDVVGALLDRTNQTITYFKNGVELGTAFTGVAEERLFPVVGLRTRDEEVLFNLGGTPTARPFKTDFAALKERTRARIISTIREGQLPLVSSKGSPLLPQLVYGYLCHHRCWQTASLVARDMLSAPGSGGSGAGGNSGGGGGGGFDSKQIREMERRQEIHKAVLEGRIDEAQSLVAESYGPQLLATAAPGLAFRLAVQKFVELLRPPSGAGGSSGSSSGSGSSSSSSSAGVAAALEYSRTVLGPAGRSAPGEEELFVDALSLLAYEDPAASPCSHLLQQSTRQALADDLNGAILSFQGQPQCSPVEQAWQQLRAVMTELRHHDHPLAVMVDEEAVVLTPPAPPAAASGGAPSGGQQGGAAGGSSSSLMGSLFGSLLLPKQAGGSGGGGGPAGSGVPGSSATAPHSHHVL